jgi:hypothetical protein
MTNIKTETAKLLKEQFLIDNKTTESLFNNGLLQDQHCRDTLIRAEYKKKVEPKEKQRIKERIASKYCISVCLVEKILSKRL